MDVNNTKNTYTLVYCDTLLSKNKIKKLLILRFLLHPSTVLKNDQCTSSLTIQTIVLQKQKNVFLNSPFHFKTVKTHLFVPTYYFTIQLTSNIRFNIKTAIDLLNSSQFVGSFYKSIHVTNYLYKI